jgi:glycosyltransferase involved in cell wall biosynthesis
VPARPIILTFVAAYLPGFKSGGPVRSVANIVEHLSDEFDFRIFTADRDLLDTVPYGNISVNCWNTVGKASVFYASRKARTFIGVRRVIRDIPYEVLYLNSVFNPGFALQPLIAHGFGALRSKSVVIAPRGEFSPGALTLKARKKSLFIFAMRMFRAYRNVIWQASSEMEATNILSLMELNRGCVSIAPNLPAKDAGSYSQVSPLRAEGGVIKICFLSRISPKKNLEFALEILKRARCPFVFDIYGPIEDPEYWRKCQSLIEKFKAHAIISYLGMVKHERVSEIIGGYDLFFLPTLGENFGHVIFEAMQVGTPVLLSDTTPWRNLENLGIGWDLPLADVAAFVAAIEDTAALTSAARCRLRDRVLSYARKRAEDLDPVVANKALFAEAVRASRCSS